MAFKKYYSIGLDLGTNSVGWSVINKDFSLVKKGGKNLWGVLLFDEAQSSKKYRAFRSARRRYERRRERIELLRTLLNQSVSEVDESFFRRMDLSYRLSDDIDAVTGRDFHYNLFNGIYTDKDYYSDYKTIYHLRNALCNQKEKADIRLVYLALHHIIKYRGNFLRDEKEIKISGNGVKEKLKDFCVGLSDYLQEKEVNISVEDYVETLNNKTIKKRDKIKQLAKESGGNDFSELIATLILGNKAKIKKTFKIESNDVNDLKFGTDTFEEDLAKLCDDLSDEDITFITSLYEVYTEYTFMSILGEGSSTISEAMMKKYDKHSADLKLLKAVLREDRTLYKNMFCSPKKGERNKLASYTNYVKTSTKRTKFGADKVSTEDFYKYVQKTLEKLPDSDEKAKIIESIELENFMPRLNEKDNGAIPYQINKTELEKIIENQEKYYPELKENKDKIISLLEFRRPYSVGVLKKGKFSWIDQEINERVYPWNFDKLVDVDRANELFIKKMVGKDAYLGTPVLPLQSITYQKYVVLNELNGLKYKGNFLDVKVKQSIYNDLVLKKPSVTIKDITTYLFNNYNLSCNNGELKGFADEKKLLGNMKTYREFRNILGEDFRESDIPLYDSIVEILTVFNDKKAKENMLKKLLKEKGLTFENKKIEELIKKTYSGWGKYSKELLTETYSIEAQRRNILTLLYETQLNIMAIFHNEVFGFKPITVEKDTKIDKLSYDLIDEMYVSPGAKRSIWQATKIVQEIIKIMGCEPENIFIESARTTEEKKRTKTRYEKLKELYKSIKQDVKYYNKDNENYIDKNKETGKLDEEKVYLYLLQCGRCMYTYEELKLDKLNDYEVDHILPRCYIKDDSIENKALVLRRENQRKASLALKDETIKARYEFWNFLKSKGFISTKKFNNLTQNDWGDKELTGFINRQLTETNQINKGLSNLLKAMYNDTSVLTVKSGLISEVRKTHTEIDPYTYGNFYKLRNLNDYHHAKDAYLVATIGLFTKEHYLVGDDRINYNHIKLEIKEATNSKKVVDLVNKRYGIIVDNLMSGKYSCVDANGEEIAGINAYNNILTVMDRNDIMVVKKKEFKAESMFYKQTIYEAGLSDNLQALKCVQDKNGNLVPLDPKYYGGYSSVQKAYSVNVEYDEKKKRVSELVGIPVLVATQFENGNENAIINYLAENGYKNARIIGKPIRKYQLLNYKGQLVHISSDKEVVNATQLVMDKKYAQMLKLIEKNNFKKAGELPNFNNLAKDFVSDYVNKLEKFYSAFSSIKEKVQEFLNNGFALLSINAKCKYIVNLLIITKSSCLTSSDADFSKFKDENSVEWNFKSSWGRMNNKKIVYDEVDWIDQSITGYYVNKITANKK